MSSKVSAYTVISIDQHSARTTFEAVPWAMYGRMPDYVASAKPATPPGTGQPELGQAANKLTS
ncbi:hypothetical protein H0B56_14680 [Haloechinothrix sp. YIM 98757]|uniref:Uncharacterized protein n=1 Tax=Haloechinothrix aidingensis TaxID=2752311 RepID=A0A838AC35_9PSEU|nr:hypothetical protein [Haloechinothrix aidingensis]MBA0126793.1 hypothetical protein [Haloechinothrix aidingensis]